MKQLQNRECLLMLSVDAVFKRFKWEMKQLQNRECLLVCTFGKLRMVWGRNCLELFGQKFVQMRFEIISLKCSVLKLFKNIFLITQGSNSYRSCEQGLGLGQALHFLRVFLPMFLDTALNVWCWRS